MMSINFSTVSTNFVSLTVLDKVTCFQALKKVIFQLLFSFLYSSIGRESIALMFFSQYRTYRNSFLLESALHLTHAPLLKKPEAIHIFYPYLKSKFSVSTILFMVIYRFVFLDQVLRYLTSSGLTSFHSFLVQQYNNVTFL